jgi:hypothetical protein
MYDIKFSPTQILGVDVDRLPLERRSKRLPPWLTPVVLQQWGEGKLTTGRRAPMSVHLRRPLGMLRGASPSLAESDKGFGRFERSIH